MQLFGGRSKCCRNHSAVMYHSVYVRAVVFKNRPPVHILFRSSNSTNANKNWYSDQKMCALSRGRIYFCINPLFFQKNHKFYTPLARMLIPYGADEYRVCSWSGHKPGMFCIAHTVNTLSWGVQKVFSTNLLNGMINYDWLHNPVHTTDSKKKRLSLRV